MTGVLALMVGESGSTGGGGGGGGATFTASASPQRLTGAITGSGTATTTTCTITASGGTAPYTQAWTRTSGDTGTNISNASAAAVTWSRVYGTTPRTDSSTWSCVVTDAASHTVTLSGITVVMNNEGSGG